MKNVSRLIALALAAAGAITLAPACGGSNRGSFNGSPDGGKTKGEAGDFAQDDSGRKSRTGPPTTCEDADAEKSYIGCDYWPTVVANNVWDIFDFAVVVANGQTTDAEITVEGGA